MMKHLTKRLIVITLVFVHFVPLSIKPEIPFTHIKGLYGVIKPEEKVYSPLNGFSWWQTGIIENMYRHGNADDATIKLIKELFFLQHDDVTFGITILGSKPASYFTASTLGRLTKIVRKVLQNGAVSKEEAQQIEKQLHDAIARDVVAETPKQLTTATNENKKLEEEKKKLKGQQTTISQKIKTAQSKKQPTVELEQQKNDIAKQIVALDAKIDTNKKEIQQTKRSKAYKRVEQMPQAKKAVEPLSKLFVAALQETLAPESLYPKFTVAQLLLAFLWRRVEDKKDFISFFKEVPEIVLDSFWVAPTIQQDWLAGTYTYEFYEQQKDTLIDVAWVLEHYEQSLFLLQAERVWGQPLPPIVSSINSDYTYQGTTYTFPNCGETSVRNFFNIVLKGPKAEKLNIALLQPSSYEALTPTSSAAAAAAPEADDMPEKSALTPKGSVTLSAPFITFYQNNTSLALLPTKQVHNAWNDAVSNLPGVSYLTPEKGTSVCEINAGLSNMMRVVNHLLFGNDPDFAALSKKEQLKKLCKTVSRPDFALTWELSNEDDDLVNERDTELRIDFSINEQEAFTWEFLDNHFVIRARPTKQEAALQKVGNLLATHLNASKDKSFLVLNQLNWLTFPGVYSMDPEEMVGGNLKVLLESLQQQNITPSNLWHFMYALPTKNADVTLNIINVLLTNDVRKQPEIKNYINKLINGLPDDDVYYKDTVISQILAHQARDYFFKIPERIDEIKQMEEGEDRQWSSAWVVHRIQIARNPELYDYMPELLRDLKITNEKTENIVFEIFKWVVQNQYIPAYPILKEKAYQFSPEQLEVLEGVISEQGITQLSNLSEIAAKGKPETPVKKPERPQQDVSQDHEAKILKIIATLEQMLKDEDEEKAYEYLQQFPWDLQLKIIEFFLKTSPAINMWQDPERKKPQLVYFETPFIVKSGLIAEYEEQLEDKQEQQKRKELAALLLKYEDVLNNIPLLVKNAEDLAMYQQPELAKLTTQLHISDEDDKKLIEEILKTKSDLIKEAWFGGPSIQERVKLGKITGYNRLLYGKDQHIPVEIGFSVDEKGKQMREFLQREREHLTKIAIPYANRIKMDPQRQETISEYKKQLQLVADVADDQKKFEALWWLTFANLGDAMPLQLKIAALKILFGYGVNPKLKDAHGKTIADYLKDSAVVKEHTLPESDAKALLVLFN